MFKSLETKGRGKQEKMLLSKLAVTDIQKESANHHQGELSKLFLFGEKVGLSSLAGTAQSLVQEKGLDLSSAAQEALENEKDKISNTITYDDAAQIEQVLEGMLVAIPLKGVLPDGTSEVFEGHQDAINQLNILLEIVRGIKEYVDSRDS